MKEQRVWVPITHEREEKILIIVGAEIEQKYAQEAQPHPPLPELPPGYEYRILLICNGEAMCDTNDHLLQFLDADEAATHARLHQAGLLKAMTLISSI
jgi:hypothetical protein